MQEILNNKKEVVIALVTGFALILILSQILYTNKSAK